MPNKHHRNLDPCAVELKERSLDSAQQALRQSQIDGTLRMLPPGQEKTYLLRIKSADEMLTSAPRPNPNK